MVFITSEGYTEPTNKLLKCYNANESGSFILYLDANHLYRQSMMQLLPTGIFDWVNPKDFSINNNSNNVLIRCLIWIIMINCMICIMTIL